MAGAVSAGAYTAGVIDYLIEALEHWQKAKELNLPGVPIHDVCIEVLSGASAGGMTAAITAASIQNDFPHISQKNYEGDEGKKNPLFNSWVNLTEKHGNDMMNQMLSIGDIKNKEKNPCKEVKSGFNSDFIDVIANRTINNVVKDTNFKRPYFADDMELLTTITNLRGYNYKLNFTTALGESNYWMTMHKDIMHFQLNETGKYHNDGKIPLHFKDEDGLNKDLLINAAMATGAFPVGLIPRVIKRDPKFINDNPLLRDDNHKDVIVNPLSDYENVNVDGGVINNEPFELTEKILENRRRAEIEKVQGKEAAEKYVFNKSSDKFDTTLLMIDPFPNYSDGPDPNYFPLIAIKFAAASLLGAMRQQLMLKTDQIREAFSEENYTRFMISPIRSSKGKTEEYSIACGALGGFGGFFSKKFRVHDFMLGRRNCQKFLQRFFSVPVNVKNPIIVFGYDGMEKDFEIKSENDGNIFLPIIPDIRVVKDEATGKYKIIKPEKETEFPYPKVKLSYLLSLRKKMIKRFGAVFFNIKNGENPLYKKEISPVLERLRKKSSPLRPVTSVLSKLALYTYLGIGISVGKKVAAKSFIDSVIADMEKRGLLEEDK